MPDRMPIIEKIIQLFTDKLAMLFQKLYARLGMCE